MARASWSVPALADEIADLRCATARFARMNGVPEERVEALELALSEAANNAVLHAFRHRARPGTVTVSIDVTPTKHMAVVVRDDGMGMTPRDDSPGLGLGLALMSALADEVEHRSPRDDAGCEIWMSFRLDDC